MEKILILIGLVWGILNLILFFKIWVMCDNVRKLTNHICGKESPNESAKEIKQTYTPANLENRDVKDYDSGLDNIKIGDKVRRISDGKVLEVTAICENELECKGGMLDGIHTYPKDSLTTI